MDSLDINSITNSLNNIEQEVSKVLTWSLNEIKVNPSQEKEIKNLLMKYIDHISDFLFLECERTGNKEVYKRFMRSMIFKRK